MPFPFALAAGIGLSALSSYLSSRSASKAAKSLPTDPARFNPNSSALDRLISQVGGGGYGMDNIRRMMDLGQGSFGDFAQRTRLRGASHGDSAIAATLRSENQQRQVGQQAINATVQQGMQNSSFLASLLGIQQQGNMFAQGLANQNRQTRAGLQVAGGNAIAGPLGQVGGFLTGQALTGGFKTGAQVPGFNANNALMSGISNTRLTAPQSAIDRLANTPSGRVPIPGLPLGKRQEFGIWESGIHN